MTPTTSDPTDSFGSRRLRGIVPPATWLRDYNARSAAADLTAGVTLAAYLLPAALGDASLANLPPEAGLYACLWGGLFFWLFCSSRHTAISVTSAISLLIGTSVGALAGGDPTRYAAIAAAVALLTAAIAFVAWLARAGSAVNFISETVMIGFKTGVALHLASTQLPKLFGVKGGHSDFWERMGVFFRHLGETNRASLLLGCGALALLILGKKFLPNRPASLGSSWLVESLPHRWSISWRAWCEITLAKCRAEFPCPGRRLLPGANCVIFFRWPLLALCLPPSRQPR